MTGLASPIPAENSFKTGISPFSLSSLTSASRCILFRNILAHAGVKRWLIADSVTDTSLLPPLCANPLQRISGSCQNPKITSCANVAASSSLTRCIAPVSQAIPCTSSSKIVWYCSITCARLTLNCSFFLSWFIFSS